MSKYRFNKERHLHQIEVNGEFKNLTGCTTVLSVIAKPALISWAAKMATEFLKDKLEGIKKLDQVNYELLLEEAKKVHTKRKESAGDYGTRTHDSISLIISDAIMWNDGFIKKDRTSKDKSVQNFLDWSDKNNIKFLSTEQNIYSEKLFIGGIVDFVCEIDGQVWIGDIKTSKSGIYPENFWQCAGYHLMIKEMEMKFANDIKGYLILNLKENGEMLEKRSISNGDNMKAFLACLEIYRIQEKIKNQII